LPHGEWISAAVDQFEVPLTQYASRLLSGDIDRARDVVQDTFLRLWTADRSSVNGHLGQWLYRVCRNRALDVRRKESRMTALGDEQLETTAAAQRGASRSRHNRMDEDHDATNPPHDLPGAAVMALLETLNDTQQEALRLKFQGGLSYKEIAAVMDITSNHVGVLIHHAIRALRERLAAGPQRSVQPGSAPP
jgi:RNA polymerase sigma-70 factor (ECF subfamily)